MSLVSLYILKGFSIDGFESGNFSFSFLSILCIQSKRASKLNTCILDMLSSNQGSNFFPFLHHLQAAWSVITELWKCFARREEEKRERENGSHSSFSPQSPSLFPSFSPTLFDLCYTQARISWRLLQKQKKTGYTKSVARNSHLTKKPEATMGSFHQCSVLRVFKAT